MDSRALLISITIRYETEVHGIFSKVHMRHFGIYEIELVGRFIGKM